MTPSTFSSTNSNRSSRNASSPSACCRSRRSAKSTSKWRKSLREEERKKRIEAAKTAHVGLRPVDTTAVDEAAAKFAASPVDYIYEQPPEQLFQGILPKYIGIQIFHALLESVAAEHAARMTAMDAATINASDMIDSLTLIMNRARQAKITKEIIEIVSGAAAQ